MRKSTMTDLVVELEKLKHYEGVPAMIAEAKAGEYHDYKNEKYICGKVQAFQILKALYDKHKVEVFFKIAMDIHDGVYDEECDEEDEAELRKMIEEDEQATPKQRQRLLQILGL